MIQFDVPQPDGPPMRVFIPDFTPKSEPVGPLEVMYHLNRHSQSNRRFATIAALYGEAEAEADRKARGATLPHPYWG